MRFLAPLNPDDLLSFIESQVFHAAWKKYGLIDEDLNELQWAVLREPKTAPVIKDTGGVRKMRFSPARKRQGKRGAYRVLSCFFEEYGLVLLVTVYPKARQDDISADGKKAIRKMIEHQNKLLLKGTKP